MALTWYRHFQRNGGLNQILRRQTSRYEKWTGDVFKISQRILRGGLPVYRIKNFNDDDIKGTFYQSELQKTDVKDDDL
jgi:hypothetical protein